MTRTLHYLRIGWTAFWGVLCISLLVLWVRSYWWTDRIHWTAASSVSANSTTGVIRVSVFKGKHVFGLPTLQRNTVATGSIMPAQLPTWAFRFGGNGIYLCCPYRLPTLVFSVIAAAPWFPWPQRFSLRNLLIAMTVLAVSLGLIMWMARR